MMRVEEKCINPEWGFYMSDVVFIQEKRRSVYHRQIFMFTSIFISFLEVVSIVDLNHMVVANANDFSLILFFPF